MSTFNVIPPYDEDPYSYFVNRLMKDGEETLKTITKDDIELLHMAVGLSGEVGETLELIKKKVFNGKLLEKEKITLELGDIFFYFIGLLNVLGLDLETVIEKNREKLNKRYHTGTYSDEQAKQRMDEK